MNFREQTAKSTTIRLMVAWMKTAPLDRNAAKQLIVLALGNNHGLCFRAPDIDDGERSITPMEYLRHKASVWRAGVC